MSDDEANTWSIPWMLRGEDKTSKSNIPTIKTTIRGWYENVQRRRYPEGRGANLSVARITARYTEAVKFKFHSFTGSTKWLDQRQITKSSNSEQLCQLPEWVLWWFPVLVKLSAALLSQGCAETSPETQKSKYRANRSWPQSSKGGTKWKNEFKSS